MTDILIPEDVSGQPVEALRRQFEVALEPQLWRQPEALRQQIAPCRALIVRNQTPVTAELLAAAEGLWIVGRAGSGLDNIDVEAASRLGIVVSCTPDQNSLSVAELTLGLMLTLARHISVASADTKAGGWARKRFMGTELYGKTIGVIGFGRIGFLVAMRAKAMGMSVLAYDPLVSVDAATVVQAQAKLVDLAALLQGSDYVTCHLPATPQTRGFFDAARFAQMKPGAYLLNLARGEVIDETALVAALRAGTLAGAALDVRAKEPPEPGPLNGLDQVILTPHIAAFTDEAQHRVLSTVCRDVEAVLRGGTAINYHNFPSPRRGTRPRR